MTVLQRLGAWSWLVTMGTFLGSCVNLPQICCVSISASPMPGRSVRTLSCASRQPAAVLVWADRLFGPLSQMSIFSPWCPSEGSGRLCTCGAFPLSLDQAVQSIPCSLALPRKDYSIYEQKRIFAVLFLCQVHHSGRFANLDDEQYHRNLQSFPV